MVSAPDLGEAAVLAAIVYPTLPDPVPALPELMLRKAAPLEAFQLQPACVDTVTVPLPLPPATEALVGLIE